MSIIFNEKQVWDNIVKSRKYLFFDEPSPFERQAAIIADLEARLQLLDERLFYVTSELAKADAMIAAMKEDSK
jgi:hypothetical protein